jgi:hypothetical protein
MASVQKIDLYSASVTANASGSAVSLDSLQTDFVAYLNVSALGAGTTATVKVERSPNGSDWFDWITFTGAAAVGKQIKDATAPGLSYARASVTFVGGATTATLAVTLHCDKKSK